MRNKCQAACLILLCFLGLFSASSARAGTTYLKMRSEGGDYIGQGGSYFYTPSTGTFAAQAYDYTGDGKVDYIVISYQEAAHWWYVTIGTNHVNARTVPGYYPYAQRAAFAEAGHPGLDVFGDGRGSNRVAGAFHVMDVVIDYSGATPRVVSFAASFVQHSELARPALYGTVLYNSDAVPNDTSPPVTKASVSGARVTLTNADPDGKKDLDATYYQIDNYDVRVYTDPIIVSGNKGETHVVKFMSVDIAGNSEALQSKTVVLNGGGPFTYLFMHSEPGDYIGGGVDQLYNSNMGVFRASASDNTGNGLADTVEIDYNDATYTHWWYQDYSTRRLGVDLSHGLYTDAQRWPFEDPGHPGLSVYGDGRGCNTLTGKFQVLEAIYDYSGPQPKLVSFAADFEQHCEGGVPALFGNIRYNTFVTDGKPRFSLALLSSSRDSVTGNIVVDLKLTDTSGGDAYSTSVNKAALGGMTTLSSLPASLGDLYIHKGATMTLVFPGTAGVAGAKVVLALTGTTTYGPFTASRQVLLP